MQVPPRDAQRMLCLTASSSPPQGMDPSCPHTLNGPSPLSSPSQPNRNFALENKLLFLPIILMASPPASTYSVRPRGTRFL